MSLPGNADVLVGINKKIADGDVGVPRGDGPRGDGPRGWYSRGYLPHCDGVRLIQSVTYRLADSLPQTKLEKLKEELEQLPEKARERERRKRIEAWLDAGMGGCALGHPAVAEYVQNSFLHFHGVRYHLHAWCIMPNHVHVLIEPLIELGTIVQGWKSYTARWILGMKAELGLKIPTDEQFWMREYWDRYIRDAGHYQRVVEYIQQNPVKAGLCQAAEAWAWSSAGIMLRGTTITNADGDVGVYKKKADGDVGGPRELQ
jgi:putative transposase